MTEVSNRELTVIERNTDLVLAHILSFLPTKYAVATSTLSPRWKHIWTSVPYLEFNEKTLLVEHPWSGMHKPKDHHRHVNQLFGLLKAISNVHLHLKASTMAALGFANDKNWPAFPNLIQLELGVCHNFCCKSLFDLLNGAPNLCTMVFAKVPLHDGFAYSEQFNWFEPQGVPS
ncbi:putative F-box protein At3g58960 [Camellia sinensis]|uniref:putative F-box protein At3g58960 n=1 Tax=Camellia sinensis TaxID=4442 RepID=UPI001035A11A|nr:putative F-box protein At3g58960 [Camellia sinensis]